ncbi:far upstream element-binding protein 2-like [Homarus americanus]|uniref:far upstream element-binding protein 2-like n=1 Tax=Homarus americanus TaxID=6706 RepID=UPI001C48F9CD|nr:far upstream element-binding protein 2-like [Homarus americanus]
MQNIKSERRQHQPVTKMTEKKAKGPTVTPQLARMRGQWVQETTEVTIKAPNTLLGVVKGSKDQPLRVVGLDKGLVHDAADHIKALVQKAVTTTKGSKDQPLRVVGLDKGLVHDAADHIESLMAYEKERRRLSTPVSQTVFIPKAHHGLIIGRQGQNIRYLSLTRRITIVLPPKNVISDEVTVTGLPDQVDQGKGSKDQPLRVVGLDKGQVHNAADHIKALVQKAVTTTVTITAPNNMLGVVVGPGGSTIKEIQEKYRVRVSVPQKGSKDQPLRVVGPDKGLVHDAADHIKALVQKAVTTTVTITAPNNMLGVVVGPGGSTIKEIQEKYKVRVSVPQKGSKDQPLRVVGPDKGLVQDAAVHIESLMAYEKERRRLSTPVSQTVFIPKAHHGLIIGRQGQNIRYLSLTRRITIVLPPKNVISDEVTVTGLPDQVDQGVRDLVNLVKSSTHICYNSDF